MIHASSFTTLKATLNVANNIQTNSMADLEYKKVLEKIDPKADVSGIEY
jgi:hypothetical protein